MDMVVKEKGVVYGVSLNDLIYARDIDNNEVIGSYTIKLSRDRIKVSGSSLSVVFSKFADNEGFDNVKIDGYERRGKVLIPRWWAAPFLPVLLIENYKLLLKIFDLDSGKVIEEYEVYKVMPLVSRRCGGLLSLPLLLVDRDGLHMAILEESKMRKIISDIRGDVLVTKSGSAILCKSDEKQQRCRVIDCDGKSSEFVMRSLPSIVSAIPVSGGTIIELPRSDNFGDLFNEKIEFTDSSIAFVNMRGSMRFLERGALSLEDAYRNLVLVYNFRSTDVFLVPEMIKIMDIDTFRDGALIDSRGRIVSLDPELNELRIHTF